MKTSKVKQKMMTILMVMFSVGFLGAQEVLFQDDFSGTLTDNWIPFGSPAATIRADVGNPAPAFDNNGDANYGSGALSIQNYDYSNGLVIETDMYVPSTPDGCWVNGSFGLASSMNYGSTTWPNWSVRFSYGYSGALCWADPDPKDEGELNCLIVKPDGEIESLHLEFFNDYLDAWHRFKIEIGVDLYVKFFIDDNLIYETTSQMSADYTNMPLLLGDRSSNYGKVYHDNLVVRNEEPETDNGIYYGDFAVTELYYADVSDWDQIVQDIFGDEYRVADWLDLESLYEAGGDLLDLYDGLGLTEYGESAYVKRNGDPSYSDTRYYFASRHEHDLPGNYLAHDNIDNYLISLGSWYGSNEIMAVRNEEPPETPSGTIAITSGTLNGNSLSVGDPILNVASGSTIEGAVNIHVVNEGAGGHVFPVAATSSWGEHSTSYWGIDSWAHTGEHDYSVNVSLTAPAAAGMYYIFFAASWEMTYANVMSLTNWNTPGGDVWNDDCDIADWSDDQAQMAIESGYVYSCYLHNEGGSAVYYELGVPCCAIRINVTDEEPETDNGIYYGDFAVTELYYADVSDWDQIVQDIFGDEYRVADWLDLESLYEAGGDLLDLYDGLGLTEYGESAYVKRNGDPSYSDTRYYFASRHEHDLPGNYLAHDNIDNYLISLGSWYGSNEIMAVRNEEPPETPLLTADFMVDITEGEVPLTVVFSDLSTAENTTIISWLWDFGDGATSSGQNPEHIYTAAGVYTVSLTVSDGNITDTETKVDFVSVTETPSEAVMVSVGDAYGYPGASGFAVPLYLTNDVDVAGVQFTLADTPGWLTATGVESLVDGFSASINEINGSVMGVFMSFSGDVVLPGEDMAILELMFDVSADAIPGDVVGLDFTDLIVSDANAQEISSEGIGGEFILGIKGDLNADLTVNILDIVRGVNIVLFVPPTPTEYESWAADMNDDGTVNILDLVAMVNLSLGISKSDGDDVFTGVVEYFVSDGKLSLNNSDDIGGIQISCSQLVTPSLLGRSSNMDIASNENMTIIYSLSGDFIQKGSGWIVDLGSENQIEELIISDRFGNSITTAELALPEDFTLSQNYPNPFNPTTVISYQIPTMSNVQCAIYDLQGRLVETLVNTTQEAGYYSIEWNAANVSSGVYFYRISVETNGQSSFQETHKMLLLQ